MTDAAPCDTTSRRTFLKAAGAAGASIVTVGAGTAAAQTYYPGVETGYEAGQAFGSWLGEKISGVLGDSEDRSGYTGANAQAASIVEGSTQLVLTTEDLLSAMQNTVEFADNAAIPKGMAAVVESLNAGGDQTDATAAMEEAIDTEYYSLVQKDVLDRIERQQKRIRHYIETVENHEDLSVDSFFDAKHSDLGHFTELDGIHTQDYTLADGSTYSIELVETRYYNYSNSFGNGGHELWIEGDSSAGGAIAEFYLDVTGSDFDLDDDYEMLLWDGAKYKTLLDDLQASRDRVYSELSTFVADTYAYYEAGDIDLSSYVDPLTAYSELRAEDDPSAYAGAAASMLGVPRSDEPMTIRLEDSDKELEGSIYSTSAPDGGFDVETTYDPDVLGYPVFARTTFVNNDGEQTADFIEIEEPFTILEAVDADGNDLDSVEITEGPQYDPSDVEALQEQLEQVYQVQLEMQEEAQSGGPLFDFGSFNPFEDAKDMAIALIVAAVGVAALGNTGGSSGRRY